MNANGTSGAGTPVSGDRPLLLDDPGKVWVVESGRVEVFAVTMEAALPTSRRHHVLTAEPGDSLWGIAAEGPGRRTALVATSSIGSSLAPLDLRELLAGAQDPAARARLHSLAASWMRKAVDGVAGRILPKKFVDLAATGELPLKKGEWALRKDDLVWIRKIGGRLAFADRDEGRHEIDIDLFPVAGYGSILALEDALVEPRPAGALTPTELAAAVEAFNGWLLRMLAAFIAARDRRDAELMDERRRQDDRIIGRSIRGLAEVARGGEEKQLWEVETESSLLLACLEVGEAAGMRITAPPRGREDLDAIADASHIRTRQVLLKEGWWRQDCGPMLGYRDEGNLPVALIPTSPRQYELREPLTDRRIPITAANESTLKPFAYVLYRPFPDRVLGPRDLMAAGLRGCWRSDRASMLWAGLLGGLLGIVVPVATGMLFTTIVPQADRPQLLQLGLFLLVSSGASLLFQLSRSTALLRTQTSMNASIQAAVWDRLLSLPLSFFRNYTTGDLATRAGGINAIRDLFSSTITNSIFAGIFSLFNFLLLFFYSPYLAWRSLLMVALSLLVTLACGRTIMRHQVEIARLEGKLNGLVLQLIQAIAKFRVSGSEKRAYFQWAKHFAAKRKAQFDAQSIRNAFAAWSAFFPIAASMWLYYLLVRGKGVDLPIGKFLAFNAAFTGFSGALLSLSATLIGSTAIVPLYKRLLPIFEAVPEHDDSKKDPGALRGDIEVSHVSFRYDQKGPIILDDVTLNIRQGEFLAVVGPSGGGKSTLTRLLLGFDIPDSGAIYYDGQDLSTLDVRAVRSQIGVVLQDSRLMSGDIFSNIVGASVNLTLRDAWDAAELAGVAADIRAMPMGMYTCIAEGGSTLSGGQRQRILIARAIVNKPRMLIFDEATSALDNRTQDVVSKNLTGLRTTRIVIAHRLSTVVKAERIVVISNGRIVQEGGYEQLEREKGLFAELAKRQLA